jgi:hypothetical protein
LLSLFGLLPSSPGLSSGSGGSLAAAFGGAALELALGSAAKAGRARATTTIAPTSKDAVRRRPVIAAIRVERSGRLIVGNPISAPGPRTARSRIAIERFRAAR